MARKTVVRHKDIIIAAALAVLTIAAVVIIQILVIMPPRALARAQGRDLTQSVKQLEENSRKERELKELVKNNAQLRARLVVFDKRLPAKGDIAALLAEMLRFVDRTDFKILQTQPKDPVLLGQGFQRFPYELELLGQYHAIGQFLNTIETHASFMQVARTDFTGSADGTIRAKILLYFYGSVNEAAARYEGDGGNPDKDAGDGGKPDKDKAATPAPVATGAKPS